MQYVCIFDHVCLFKLYRNVTEQTTPSQLKAQYTIRSHELHINEHNIMDISKQSSTQIHICNM